MSVAELKAELKRLGGDVRGNLSRGEIERRLAVARAQVVEVAVPTGTAETVAPVSTFLNAIGVPEPAAPASKPRIGGCSEAEVLTALSPHLERGMTATFMENCWEFKFKDRSDSGTMSQPLENIKKCADLVMRESVSAGRIGLAGRQVI